MYTCNTCALQFPTPEDQRSHMKSDWHRYNLKRRVANLPSIDESLFNEKVQKLTINEDAEDQKKEDYSKSKQITKKEQRRKDKEVLLEKKRQLLEIAKKNMINSLRSDGRITAEVKPEGEIKEEVTSEEVILEEKTSPSESIVTTESESVTEEQKVNSTTEQSETSAEELTEEQELERIMQQKLENKVDIPKEVCLFCNKKFPYFEANVTHMFKKHGFYIPEQKYLVDKEGLVNYMAEKIGVGNLCIVCNYQGRSLEAVRAHMVAKKHSIIPYESENERLEISEFYDFTSTYNDLNTKSSTSNEENADEGEWEDVSGDEVASDEEEEEEVLPQQVSYNDGVELHLPSGIKVGHRELARYYKQNLRPEVVLSEGQGTVIAAESRHLVSLADRTALLEKKRIWRTEKSHTDRDDRRAAKFINNQPYYRDQLLQ